MELNSVSVETRRYAGFFHYKNDESIEPLIEWLKARSLSVVWCLEHTHHVNETDKHIQWAIVTDEEWQTKWTSEFNTTNTMGKKYLVPSKTANEGSKSSKRWSKMDATKKGWDWPSMCAYVLKAAVEVPHGIWHRDGHEEDVTKYYGVHAKNEEKKTKKKTMAYKDEMLELWMSKGCPKKERDCFEMLCDHVELVRWNYVDGRSIRKMARWLSAQGDKLGFKERMMHRYDRGDFDI